MPNFCARKNLQKLVALYTFWSVFPTFYKWIPAVPVWRMLIFQTVQLQAKEVDLRSDLFCLFHVCQPSTSSSSKIWKRVELEPEWAKLGQIIWSDFSNKIFQFLRVIHLTESRWPNQYDRCSIFRPAFGWWAPQTLVKIVISSIVCAKKLFINNRLEETTTLPFWLKRKINLRKKLLKKLKQEKSPELRSRLKNLSLEMKNHFNNELLRLDLHFGYYNINITVGTFQCQCICTPGTHGYNL